MKATIKKIIRSCIGIAKHQTSRCSVRKKLSEKKPIFLEVGAGDKKGENGWTTIDMTKNCDVYWDLRKGIPFPDESVSKLYSSHFLEHLTFRDGQAFLKECMRVLVPGGQFLICLPNARLYIEAYLSGSTLDPNQFFRYKPAYNNTTRIDYVNHIAYMNGEHKYMFDEENILYILRAAGFRNVRPRRFDASIDVKDRESNSIFAEAEK